MFMNNFKKFPFFFIIILFIVGCGKNPDKQIVLKCGHGVGKKHPVSVAIRYFAVQVYQKSKGRITINIFPDESLGSENKLVKEVQSGKVDMVKISASDLANIIPNYSVLCLPYLYKNTIQYLNALHSGVGQEILRSGDKYGLIGLTFYYAGSRSFYTKTKFIMNPDDLENMKIRVQPNEDAINMVKALGGIPVPMPYGEVFKALESGDVDGAENNIPTFYSSRNYELCKFYSYDEHTKIPDVLLINKKTWNHLSKNDQKIILDAAKKSNYIQLELWRKDIKKAMEVMKLNDVKFKKVNKKAFQDKVETLYTSLSTKEKRIVKVIRETNSKNILNSD
jgi:tripartite ATP-independent transporter DctP family solute receptor